MVKTDDEIKYVVKSVVPEKNYILLIKFIDGSEKRYDAKSIIARGGLFERLRDQEYFEKAHVDRDTVVWDDILDIAPETLYEQSVPIS